MSKNFSESNSTTELKFLKNSTLSLILLAAVFLYSYYHYFQSEQSKQKINKTAITDNFQYTPKAEWSLLETQLKARSLMVANLDTKEIYFSRHPDVFVNIASLSKLMTAIITIDNLNLNKIITISAQAVNTYGSGDYLQVGEKLTVKNLLNDLLVFSSNDAAVALAEGVGYNRFIGLMNRKAKDIGMRETAFFDSTGLDEKGNFSNASDLLTLVNHIYHNYFLIGDISRLPSVSFQSLNGIEHNLKNTDELIGKISGLWLSKTGITDNAGECLILVYRLNNGQAVVSIVLGSIDRFGDSWLIYEQFKKAGLTI